MQPVDLKLEDIKTGDFSTIEVKITQESQNDFAKLSGDFNPLHTDMDYAKSTALNKPVVYGVYLASLVSRLVGMQLPGKRSLIVDLHLSFHKPVFVEDSLSVICQVAHVSIATRLVDLMIKIERENEVCVSGQVIVRVLE